MLMFGRVLLEPGLVKYVVVAERKGAHQGITVMSYHVVIDDIMEWFNSCAKTGKLNVYMEASWWISG